MSLLRFLYSVSLCLLVLNFSVLVTSLPAPCSTIRCPKGTECAYFKETASCVPISCEAANPCEKGKVCVDIARQCVTSPCPQFDCVEPCSVALCPEGTTCIDDGSKAECIPVDCKAKNACGPGQECTPIDIECITAPCIRFQCVAMSCEAENACDDDDEEEPECIPVRKVCKDRNNPCPQFYCTSARCPFTCPNNSIPKRGKHCISKFDHCKCNQHYRKKDGACQLCSEFTCPNNSTPKKRCVKKVSHCKCDYGFKLEAEKCTDCSTYQCPQDSIPKGECVTKFGDCECKDGFRKEKSSNMSKCIQRDDCIVCPLAMPSCDESCQNCMIKPQKCKRCAKAICLD
mmetsp:Transcript_4145/g.5207  ORF Transcript_4145/g.5207 Transcript_4145/m.5207 type:complete len:344 (+) Transcript_4145:347-1378(+)